MIECHDECDPHTPPWISWSNWMPYSLEIHLIIMPFGPHRYSIPSIRWYILDLCMIHSTSVLLSNGGWLSMNILIGLIQSYASPWSASSITIRSGFATSIASSAGLIKGLVNFSMITSDGLGALEEAIQGRWYASRLSKRGTYYTSNPLKNFSILHTSAKYLAILSLF
jgi:hypothetical protein